MDLRDGGVSSAIGIILLIAIVLVIAGGVGSVFLSKDTPEPAPSASLSAKATGKNIYIHHDGGDTIADATKDFLVKLNGEDIDPENITVGGSENNLKTGDSMEISVDFSKGDKLKVIHKPSNTILLETAIKKSGSNQKSNTAPTADADGSYTVDEGGTVQLDGTGSSDPDGTIENYSWKVPSGPGFLQDADNSKPTYVAPNNVDSDTSVTVELTVTDDDGATDSDNTTVTVEATGGCPYLYGWNGGSYELINATMPQPVLKKYETTSYQITDTLKPRDDYYDLTLFQKLPEKARINNLSLKAIDYPKDVEILTDQTGRIYTIDDPQPVDAVDEEGRDITHLLENSDEDYWTSDLEGREFENIDDLVDHITLRLPENEDSRIKLIIRGRQTIFAELSLWSVYHYMMGTPNFEYLKNLLENDDPSSLGAAFDNSFGRFSSIRLQYWNGSEWKDFGKIGILKAFFEKTVVPIDLGKIPGNRIRLSMTAGLYDIDQILVDSSSRKSISSRKLEPIQATKHGDEGTENVLKKIREIDNKYAIIDKGEYINYKFEQLHPLENGMERTFILPTGGYFYLTGPEGPENERENLALVKNLARTPYKFERWILPRYTYPKNYSYTEYFHMNFAEPPFETSD